MVFFKDLEFKRNKELKYKLVQGGNVPGGHNCIYDGIKKPFITPMRECNSIKLRYSDVVIDIGAYVGTYSIRCARYPVKKVVAYEPTPRSFKILELTKLLNLKNINAAVVGDNKKSIDLYISKGIGVTNSIIPSRAKPTIINVSAINYIKAVKDATIVKIDIEGGEYDLPIVQPGIRAFIIDFHKVGKDWLGKAHYIMWKLQEAGFEPIIEPDFSCGWTCAGSWLRPMETFGEYTILMQGKACCGCGHKINGKKKSICNICEPTWSKKHKEGYNIEERI